MRLTAAADARAADRIAARRRVAGDPALDALPSDPAGVVAYVCAHTTDVPLSVLAEDVVDALVVIRELRTALDRQELGLLHLGQSPAVGLSWSRLAVALGVRTRQAAQQRALRLGAQQEGRGRSAIVRAVHATREAAWLARNATQINAAADAALASAEPGGEDVREVVEGLIEAVADPQPSLRELMAWLSMLAGAQARAGQRPLPAVTRLVAAWETVRPPG